MSCLTIRLLFILEDKIRIAMFLKELKTVIWSTSKQG